MTAADPRCNDCDDHEIPRVEGRRLQVTITPVATPRCPTDRPRGKDATVGADRRGVAAGQTLPIRPLQGPGPWEWTIAPYVPGGITDGLEVAGPPPGPHVAAEVGTLAAQALTGEVTLRRR
jgi:hypothetical protein